MTIVIRDTNKTIAKAAGWDLASCLGRWGVFVHAATGRVVEISARRTWDGEYCDSDPEGFDTVSVLWANLVAKLKQVGLNSDSYLV